MTFYIKYGYILFEKNITVGTISTIKYTPFFLIGYCK